MATPPVSKGLSAEGTSSEIRKTVEAIAPPLNQFMLQTSSALTKALTLAENLDAQIHTFKITVPTDWIAVTFQAPWDNVDPVNNAPAQYRKTMDGMVQVQGRVLGGVLLTEIFVLPVGYRPSCVIDFGCVSDDAFASVQVARSGGVAAITGGVSTFLDIGTIQFPASDRTPIAPSCWPYAFKCTTRAKPKAVLVGAIEDTQDLNRTVHVGAPSWAIFDKDGSRMIRIKHIPGLAPGRTYAVTLVVLGG